MNNKILEFRKTNHFMYNQWHRCIDDKLLYEVLALVDCTKCEEDVVFVMPSFLQRKGIEKDNKQCLILVIKKGVLITAYWCDKPNYLFNKKEKVHFQLLY